MNLKLLAQPQAVRIFLLKRLSWMIPAKYYLEMLFFVRMGYKLDLKNPKTFNEKLQWLKLYDRKPEYRRMVDKYTAKEYVAEKLGDKYVVPTLGVWERPEDIEWEKLPNQFVLKTTHGGGSFGVVICTNKESFNRKKAVEELNKSMKSNIWKDSREWPYRGIHKRVIAEEYLNDDTTSVKGDLNDYKFYCFSGKVKYCEVITGRHTKKQIDFFDLDWNHMPFTFEGRTFSDNKLSKPECFPEMIAVADTLCKGLPYSRIDMYVVHGKVYFGEITFFPASGFRGFAPKEWNIKLGDMIQLPNVNK